MHKHVGIVLVLVLLAFFVTVVIAPRIIEFFQTAEEQGACTTPD